MTRLLTVLAVTALAGCSSPGPGLLAAMPPGGAVPSQTARSVSDASPGENPSGLPGENPSGLPGENPSGLPGENPSGLPGAAFACTGVPARGIAACTIAINLKIAPNPAQTQPASLIAGLHPSDLQAAYALPASSAGGLVAVVDAYDDPTAESDLAVYRAAFGLPPCTSANGCFRKAGQRGDGALPTPNAAWSEETALDLDMVSAGCPSCSILLVEASSASLDDLGAAVDTAAAQGPAAISNSYYAVEWPSERSEDVHYRHPGIAITASSGDRGYPSYPAAAASVTSVGGTSLAAANGGWSESPWQYTGHGCSAYIRRPTWQSGTPCSGARSAVDVSAVADPQTGVATFDAQAGGWYVAGGTSVGAPLVAAAYALSGRPAGPRFSYEHPSSFRAVGGTGYQPITGLGAPQGVGGL